jgi:hypothetical protein
MNFNVKDLLVPWHELILGDGEVRTRPAEGHEAESHTMGSSSMVAGTMSAGSTSGIDTSAEMSPNRDMTEDLPDEDLVTPGRSSM